MSQQQNVNDSLPSFKFIACRECLIEIPAPPPRPPLPVVPENWPPFTIISSSVTPPKMLAPPNSPETKNKLEMNDIIGTVEEGTANTIRPLILISLIKFDS